MIQSLLKLRLNQNPANNFTLNFSPPNLEDITKFGDFYCLKIRPLSKVKRIFSNDSTPPYLVVTSLP